MGEYFKPWRRKIGVVTLVMASVFMAVWVRSLCVRDGLQFCSGKDTMENFVSVDSSVIWGRMHIVDHEKASMTMFHITKYNYMPLYSCLESMSLECSWHGPGFGVGQPPLELSRDWGLRMTYWIIPYWSIVLPFTALSAYLLLSNPRPSAMQMALPSPVARV